MSETNNWHKRHALNLASGLPDNADDARAVLRAVQDLVELVVARRTGACSEEGSDAVARQGLTGRYRFVNLSRVALSVSR